jgi:hypothetical protein
VICSNSSAERDPGSSLWEAPAGGELQRFVARNAEANRHFGDLRVEDDEDDLVY